MKTIYKIVCLFSTANFHRRTSMIECPKKPRSHIGWMLVALSLTALASAARAGTWVPLAHPPPMPVGHFLLLSDGTVMGIANPYGYGSTWLRLTPDSHGSYVNGTWSTTATMHYTRLDFASIVLKDGRVFVAGGEYGTGTNNAEVYDPVANTWTTVGAPPAGTSFLDSDAILLPNGNVLIAPVYPATYGGTIIFNPSANTLTAGPTLHRGYDQDEATWVKLPDDSILTIDTGTTNSERYIPSSNTWINDANVPDALYDPYGTELGGGLLLPNGKAIFFGGTPHTAIYTPSGNTSPGSWVAGPDFPNGQGQPDAPDAMEFNGKVLCVVEQAPTNSAEWYAPVSFYEYDYVSNSFARVSAPGGGTTFNDVCWPTLLCDLPDGTILFGHRQTDFYVYQPGGSPLAAGTPTIATITTNANGSVHLTGTLFNGLCQGASYGDDEQMDSNFPLVRFTDGGGTVRYGRTYNWSSDSVMTGNAMVSTDCTLPAGASLSDLIQVVANGIASVGTGSVVISTNDSVAGSLRQIVASVPANTTITFATNLSGKAITLTDGAVALNNNVTIDGSALASPLQLNGNHNSRIFTIGGGAVVTLNSLVLTNAFMSGGNWGGAIQNSGTLAINNCTLAGNSVDSADNGGAIENNGPLTLNGCTFYGNSAGFSGALDNRSTCTAMDCTFYGNTAVAGNGGAIDNPFSATLSLLNCTFYGNSATSLGGDIDNYLSQLNITNTILAASAPDDIYNWAGSTNTAGGSNIVQVLDNAGTHFGANNVLAVNPLLGPLANNGGPTLTMLPQPGSPAIDAGVSSAAAGVATDQRGFPRVLGAAVDIGAVESFVLPVTFYGTGVYWSSNQNGAYTTPTITNNVLRLTDGPGNAARSVFFQLQQYIGAFKASFTYQDVSGGADGVAFVLQNDPRGTSALGGVGGSLGFGTPNPITPSAALELNIYTGNGEIVGYTFLTNGLTGASGANGNYQAPGAINLGSGHPIGVTLNYASTQLSLTFTDAIAGLFFSTNLNVGRLTDVVGGATAFVGFTGADGGVHSTQIITNFSFESIPTETINISAGQLLISWPAAISGYTLQQNSKLNTTNWVNLPNQPVIVNGQNQITLPLTATNEFYRLKLP
jgi:hypothetical protein